MRYVYGVILTLFVIGANAQNGGITRPDIPGDLMVDIGLNYWDQSDSLNQKGWPSKSIAIYYTKSKFLSNKFTFKYGLGFGMEKISLGDTKTLVGDKDTVAIIDIPQDLATVDVRKNKLAVTYLDIPIELRFYPKGTTEGEGLFVSVGGILGLRMSAHTKLKIDAGGEKGKLKISGKYGLNTFRYGLQGRIGFNGVHIFYKRFFSNTFKNNVLSSDGTNFTDLGYNPTLTTIGINITGF